MEDFFKRYRTRLKLSATENLEETIKKVFNMIADDSDLKNTVIIIQARYQNLEQDSIKQIISESDRVLRTNKILNNLFELIDNIQIADLQEADDVLLNKQLREYNAKKTAEKADEQKESKESSVSNEITPLPKPDPVVSEVEISSVNGILPDNKSEEIEPKSAKDLEIFSEMYRKDLTFFPVIYRDIRSLVFKNGKADLATAQLIQQLEAKLPAMKSYQVKINQLEPILSKVRVDYDKKVYWLQYQQLANKRTQLKVENLSELENMNQQLDDFIIQLKNHKIIG